MYTYSHIIRHTHTVRHMQAYTCIFTHAHIHTHPHISIQNMHEHIYMYVYMCIPHTHKCTDIEIHDIHMHTYTHACVYAFKHTELHSWYKLKMTHMCVHIHMYEHMCIHMHTNTCIFIGTHSHMHTHTYVHTHATTCFPKAEARTWWDGNNSQLHTTCYVCVSIGNAEKPYLKYTCT